MLLRLLRIGFVVLSVSLSSSAVTVAPLAAQGIDQSGNCGLTVPSIHGTPILVGQVYPPPKPGYPGDVLIMPDSPVSRAFVQHLQAINAPTPPPGQAVDIAGLQAKAQQEQAFSQQVQSLTSSMHLAQLRSTGLFKCLGLSPGRYIVVARVA